MTKENAVTSGTPKGLEAKKERVMSSSPFNSHHVVMTSQQLELRLQQDGKVVVYRSASSSTRSIDTQNPVATTLLRVGTS